MFLSDDSQDCGEIHREVEKERMSRAGRGGREELSDKMTDGLVEVIPQVARE